MEKDNILNIGHSLWTEKYRPDFDGLILPQRVKDRLAKGVEQNFLFYGSPGTGKTSTAKALVNHFKLPYLYINASKDAKIDTLRERITAFCSTRSIMDEEGKFKVVILDEIDGASEGFFKAFKASMEEFSINTRFIATSNFVNKIPEAVLSRFAGGDINFDFDKEEETELLKAYTKRLYTICTKEELTIDPKAAYSLVQRRFPDMRSMLNVLQAFKAEGIEKVTIEDVKKFNSIFKDVFELIFNNIDPVTNYQMLVSNYSNKVDDVLASLGTEFIDFIKSEQPMAAKYIPQIIITVAKYQTYRATVIDHVIPMTACIFEIQSIIKGA